MKDKTMQAVETAVSPVMTFEKVVHALDKVCNPLSRIMDVISRVILAFMVLLITSDVALRYIFNRPIKGSFELIELILVVITFLGLAYAQVKKDHVAVTLITDKLKPSTRSLLACGAYLLCTIVFILITWQSIARANLLMAEGTSSDLLLIPLYPFMWIAVFGSATLCLAFLRDFIHAAGEVLRDFSMPWIWLGIVFLTVLVISTIPFWLNWLAWDISRPVIGTIALFILIVLLLTGMLIGPVMALIGFLGFAYLVNIDASNSLLGTVPFRSSASHSMSTIPLFVLMGMLCFHSELSSDFYRTMQKWLGRLPGGLAMSTIGGCAGFAAVSGSSLATAITMGTIALPEMKRYRYADSLACGCVAAGGSIGILIPPSIVFIIYAGLTEESIGRLFMAGVIPGLLEVLLYLLVIYVMCKLKPEYGPPGPSSTFKEKIVSLKDTWGILALFTMVIGGIYMGIFTPTESAGVGAFGALLLGLLKKKMTWKKLMLSLTDAVKNTAMIMLLLIGANIFGYFLTMSQIPFNLSDFVVGLPFPNSLTMATILFAYIILGAIMPVIPAVVLTVPIFFPVVTGLGYDPIWFGVMVVMVVEIGQITPPMGINVFALAGVAKGISLETVFKGILPFLATDILRIILIFLFPALALFIPSLMMGQ